MSEVLTRAEICAKYDSEWVLVGDPRSNELLALQAGTVLWHSKDRDEVYRKMIESSARQFAILYTGPYPKDMAFLL